MRRVESRDWRLSWRLMAAARLRLRSWLGFSKYSCLRTSVSTPAFSQVRLKRRSATSNDSLSRIRTEGIYGELVLGPTGARSLQPPPDPCHLPLNLLPDPSGTGFFGLHPP